jgi:hypothetical protein
MKPTRLFSLLTWIALSATARTATAHEVWIEDSPTGEMVVRFAEWGDEYEKSPGHLDSLAVPEAWSQEKDGTVTPIQVKKGGDGFPLSGASKSMSLQAETVFNVIGGNPQGKGDQAGPVRRPFFYARWQVPGTEAGKPAMNFDIVPTGKPNEVCVYFRGKPLPDVEVFAHMPEGREATLKSDKSGIVTVPSTAPGIYMLNCKRYRETISGFVGGRAYTTVSHNCSLTWRTP